MSRARIDAKAYPLVYLKSQIIEYKLKRLDGILGAVKAHTPINDETARTALSELLDVASELLIGGGGLGLVKYSHRAASYYGLRREVVSSDKWPPLLKELGGVIAKDGGAAAELVRAFAALDDALRAAVQSLWEKTDDAPAAELAKAGIENSCRTTAAPKLNTVRVGSPEARRTVLEVSVVAWLELLEILAAPVAAAAKAAAAGDWSRLKCLSPSLYALPVAVLAKFAREQKELGRADGDLAMQRYYRLRVWWRRRRRQEGRGGRDAREGGSQAWGRRRRRRAAARRAAARRFRLLRRARDAADDHRERCGLRRGEWSVCAAGYVPAGAAVGAPGGAALADPVPAAVGDELVVHCGQGSAERQRRRPVPRTRRSDRRVHAAEHRLVARQRRPPADAVV